jgi:hypothetical protein
LVARRHGLSQRAITLAVRDYLAGITGWDNTKLDCTPGGQPSPVAGETFVSVHSGGCDNVSDLNVDEVYSVLITISQRAGRIPFDRVSNELIHKMEVGMDALVDAIKSLVHMDPRAYKILKRANEYIEESHDNAFPGPYGFSEPLRFRNCTIAQPKPAGWWHGESSPEIAGFSMVMTFNRARRIQDTRNQEFGQALA